MLNCMATYRCADKKPHDNITEEPTIHRISSPASAIADTRGGELIRTLIKKSAGQSVDCFATTVVGVNETGDGSSTIAGIAGARINDFAGANICAKFLVEPAGEGKVLCPSVR